MGHTKKVGLAGKFGARYGSRTRHAWREITEKQKGIQKCPKCETKVRNMREFIGVWHCKKCGARWTGGAWISATSRGKESHRIATRIARELTESEKSQ
jgi:large subunit ribosomal protein L37Ae